MNFCIQQSRLSLIKVLFSWIRSLFFSNYCSLIKIIASITFLAKTTKYFCICLLKTRSVCCTVRIFVFLSLFFNFHCLSNSWWFGSHHILFDVQVSSNIVGIRRRNNLFCLHKSIQIMARLSAKLVLMNSINNRQVNSMLPKLSTCPFSDIWIIGHSKTWVCWQLTTCLNSFLNW